MTYFHLRESSILDLIDNHCEFRALVVKLQGVVSPGLQDLDLVDRHPEDEDVLQAHLLSHLNVGSVHRSDCQSSVQLKYTKHILLKK